MRTVGIPECAKMEKFYPHICIGENGTLKRCTKTISCSHLLHQYLHLNSALESEKTEDFKNCSFIKNGMIVVLEM